MNRGEAPVAHRSNFREPTLNYVEVGASEAQDLLKFPPNDATAFHEELHLGSGHDRFLTAASTLMTWRAFERAGLEVAAQRAGEAPQYAGLAESDTGELTPVPLAEELYGPDGQPYVAPGTIVSFRVHGKLREVYVVRVIHALREVGLVLGTAGDDAVTGEIRVTVQLRDDDTVWGTVRGFAHAPKTMIPLLATAQVKSSFARAKQILKALRPGGAGGSVVAERAAADPAGDAADPAASGSVADDSRQPEPS